MPSELIPSCGSIIHPSQLNKEGCQDDILGFLDTFLKFGIEVEFQEQDAYFLKCKECKSVDGVCGFNSSDPKKAFLCSQDLSGKKDVKTRPRLRVVMMFLCVLFLCVLLFILVKKYVSRKIKTPAEDAAVVYLHRHRSASLLPPVFTFDELQLATDNFDPSRKIGDGGFGSVYIGHFQENKVFAIKAVDGRRDKREIALVDMAVGRIQMGLLEEVIDPRLAAVDSSSVAAMAELSFRCVAADKDDRPDAREVVAELKRIKGRVRGAVGTVRVLASSNVVVPDGVL
ncbi:protein kinase superfamily protein [Artemisia annua]|uniref:Protein kinase superfamily protein n=1 Tax=Artemisia annua TaxID=35608 RepID=A0A2U1MWT4_ARTAN|nr:protein kinase superfamily protein [Artemisia annua]